MSRKIPLSIGLLALAAVGLAKWGDTPVHAAKPLAQTYVGELTIDPQTGDGVKADPTPVDPFGTLGGGTYRDYQANPGDGKNFCVNGALDGSGAGDALFRLDRKQGFTDGLDLWCNQRIDPNTNNTYQARQYQLILRDPTACSTLSANESGVVDQAAAPCTLTSPVWPNATLQPHIDLGTVFSTKRNSANSTPVFFDFTPATGTAYRVLTDQNATVTGTTNVKVVSYSGTAYLKYTGVQGARIGGSFSMPFHMIVKRIAVNP